MKSAPEMPKQAISASSIVVVRGDQVSRDLDGEAAVLNLSTGMYYGLNSVGARIWGLLGEPKTVIEILDALLTEYDVDATRCQSDLVRILNELAEAGLIEVKNEGAP